MQESYVSSRREMLYDRWESIAEHLYYEATDIEEFKTLVYDTYEYFRQSRDYNSVLREDIPIFRFMCKYQFCTDIPSGNTEAEFTVCQSFAESLCWVIENGFERGYYKISMPLELSYHNSHNEADMSSFESFCKAFDSLMQMYKEEYEELEEETED